MKSVLRSYKCVVLLEPNNWNVPDYSWSYSPRKTWTPLRQQGVRVGGIVVKMPNHFSVVRECVLLIACASVAEAIKPHISSMESQRRRK